MLMHVRYLAFAFRGASDTGRQRLVDLAAMHHGEQIPDDVPPGLCEPPGPSPVGKVWREIMFLFHDKDDRRNAASFMRGNDPQGMAINLPSGVQVTLFDMPDDMHWPLD